MSLHEIFTTHFSSRVRLTVSDCAFCRREVKALGHKISLKRVAPSAVHVNAIRAIVEPASGDELMRFIGLMYYFARLAHHFADLAKPM